MESARLPADAAAFRTTRWSCVLALRGADDALARRALAELCEAYWSPLYAYLRRSGSSHVDAEDLVQGFFGRLTERRDLHADPSTVRLRSYLLGALRHYVANERARGDTARRGGRVRIVSMDEAATSAAVRELRDSDTPERAYERQFALALLDAAHTKLRAEARAAGRETQFDVLHTVLARDADAAGYAQLAETLGQSAGSLRVAVHRMRRRLGELLREEVAATLAPDPLRAPAAGAARAQSPATSLERDIEPDIGAELAHLFAALGR
jgi:RNA polymerase sigma-70 factor (ECF subfamily)